MKGTLHLPKKDPFCMIFSVGPKKGTPKDEYITTKHDISYMKQSVVAWQGKCVVVAAADEFWGGPGSKPYRSKVMNNPTWGQLFQCAKAAQKKTLDLHHCFFEGVYCSKDMVKAIIDGQEVIELKLALGS
jgi:hypothetical protein